MKNKKHLAAQTKQAPDYLPLPADTVIHNLTPYAVQEGTERPVKKNSATIKPKKFENGNLPALINRNQSEPGFKPLTSVARKLNMPGK